ncbi:MAG: hypothetical protein HDR88_04095 [Bacteroides sp.]|nr:hypothetical protein [Bacteroides sp.]
MTLSDLHSSLSTLITRYEQAGGFTYPRITNPEIRQIQTEGKIQLREAKYLITHLLNIPLHTTPQPTNSSSLSSTSLSHLPQLLSVYDLLYRICYGKPNADFVTSSRLAAVDRWIKGDKTLTQTDIVIMLAEEIDRDIRGIDPKYVRYCLTTQEKWLKEFTLRGRFLNTPSPEAQRRLRFLSYRIPSLFNIHNAY